MATANKTSYKVGIVTIKVSVITASLPVLTFLTKTNYYEYRGKFLQLINCKEEASCPSV